MTSVLLPDPDAPVIAISLPSGNRHVDRLGGCSRARRARPAPVPLPVPPRTRRRRSMRLPDRNWPVGDALHLSTSSIVPCTTTRAAVHARAGPHLDDVIGGANRVLVVLDDDHRVADVAEPLERGDHLDVVLRVQADARLVEHVEHAHQPRSDLRRQPDPLRFAARERAGAAVEAQVVQADAEQQTRGGRGSPSAPGGRRRRRGPTA